MHEAPACLLSIAPMVAQLDADHPCAARLLVDDGFPAFIRGVAARVIQHHWRRRTRMHQGVPEHLRGLVRLTFGCGPACTCIICMYVLCSLQGTSPVSPVLLSCEL